MLFRHSRFIVLPKVILAGIEDVTCLPKVCVYPIIVLFLRCNTDGFWIRILSPTQAVRNHQLPPRYVSYQIHSGPSTITRRIDRFRRERKAKVLFEMTEGSSPLVA